MKTKILFLLITLFFTSCEPKKEKCSKLCQEIKGEHRLRTFNVFNETTKSWSTNYFLIMSNSGGSERTETKVKFSWLNNKNQYIISELPISKIRVEINDTIENPIVKFRWIPTLNDIEYAFKRGYIEYMVIICKEEDYPININIKDLSF